MPTCSCSVYQQFSIQQYSVQQHAVVCSCSAGVATPISTALCSICSHAVYVMYTVAGSSAAHQLISSVACSTAIHCYILHATATVLLYILQHADELTADMYRYDNANIPERHFCRILVKALTHVLLTFLKALDCRGQLILPFGNVSYIHSTSAEQYEITPAHGSLEHSVVQCSTVCTELMSCLS